MYKQVDSNKRKTYLIIALFFGLMLLLGWVFSLYFNNYIFIIIAFLISLVQVYISYYYSDKIALAVAGAKPASKKDHLELFRIVENLSITAGLPMPDVYIIPDTAINAFATGRDPKHASVAVTEGAIERLNKNELEGVIAHELSHVGNRDILVMSVVLVLVGALVLASDFFLRSLWFRGNRDNDRDNNGVLLLVGIVLAILTPVIATLLQLAISRKREYLADASGALLTRYPEGLASALEKIAKDKEPLETANKATAMFYIKNPLEDHQGFLNNLFATHPPIADRIKRLRQMA